MGYLDRYRKRVLGNPETAKANFIEMALNKITIQKYESGEILESKYDAVLIFRDKEGPDYAKLYTYADDGLKVGDCIVKKGEREENDVYFLITEEVKRVDTSVKIRVYNTLEANVNVSVNDELKPAYFTSNLRSKIRASGRGGVEIEVKESVLVAPISYNLKLDEVLNISNLTTNHFPNISWQVYGTDDISSPTVAYHHLTQVMKKQEPVTGLSVNLDGKAYVGEVIRIDSEHGFLETSVAATVVKRTATYVEVQVPVTDIFRVTVKQDGETKILEYEVIG